MTVMKIGTRFAHNDRHASLPLAGMGQLIAESALSSCTAKTYEIEFASGKHCASAASFPIDPK
jgi:hypothetical protein